MAYPPHALVAIIGKNLGTEMPAEVWQIGIRVSTHDPSGGFLANPQTYANAIAPNISTWFNGTALFSNLAQLTVLKVNNIKPDGTYNDPVTHSAPISGTGGTAPVAPAFCSLATTLETGRTTGRARRGRIYLPTVNPLASGFAVSVSSAVQTSLRDKVKALLTILATNEPTGGLLVFPQIVSKIDASHNDITAVSVNSVIDVQRRRKNRATGTRISASFP